LFEDYFKKFDNFCQKNKNKNSAARLISAAKQQISHRTVVPNNLCQGWWCACFRL